MNRENRNVRVILSEISKSYGEKQVLTGIEAVLASPERYGLVGRSGCGKTTLLRLLLSLEKPDAGVVEWRLGEGQAERIQPHPLIGAVFQEDRLCEGLSALENAALVIPRDRELFQNRALLRRELLRLLPEDALEKPVARLSGGQRRRAAIARAMCAPEPLAYLMDEPLTGLDRQTKEEVTAYIREKTEGALFLVATHEAEDMELLGVRQEHILRLRPGGRGFEKLS